MASPDEYQALILTWWEDLTKLCDTIKDDRFQVEPEAGEILEEYASALDEIKWGMDRMLWSDARGVRQMIADVINVEANRRADKRISDSNYETTQLRDELRENERVRVNEHNKMKRDHDEWVNKFEQRVEEEVQRRMYGTVDVVNTRKRVVMI